ncbi:DUF349 domain-containing protein [Massilia psychrophila]|uniref:DUF349 domain-containing protein n=1 Tax=Massilia psychrophila TaxID=1603353 RepID=A0A2G8SYY6_9BURK|nr:DUF349 domain-containing protein [Massilia psychrophila]PIL38933.1 hypothetical protein CR103_15395 [Massilia psychrophila]GGE71975.1 hypothetical protein GCM10008020_15800 [Massilia psychrophila]
MFEFLFKRPDDKPGDMPAGKAAKSDPAAAPAGAQRALQAEKVKQLAGNEVAAADFILQCDFSELRLAAAEFVRTPAQLERVHAAIRNTDRRVAKLMQSRLDAIRHHQSELQRGQACLDHARQLLADEKLTPNQVAELDRRWAVIAAPELMGEFDLVRTALARRLEAQVVLQRGVIDSVTALRKLASSALPVAEVAASLEQLDALHAAALVAPEYASLPRHLVTEFAAERARLASSIGALEQGEAALAGREAMLALWQAQATATLNVDALKKEWSKLPPGPPGDAAAGLQQRFDALLASVPQEVRKPKEARPAESKSGADPARSAGPARPSAPGADQHFLDELAAMEAALQQGSLGSAAEHDKALKDSKGMRLTAAQSERLAHARGELKRLSDWARWGGNVSREELIKAVENLTTQSLVMSELAKKVGSMRERWKALDTLSGAAPKSLWERFDAACGAAYAPAAAHFKHLAEERHTNAAKAQALIAEANAQAAGLAGADSVDWKQMAVTVQRLRLGWSHLGAIDRKDKKRLDQQFADVLNVLQAPLEQQRKSEVAHREELIEQVAALDASDRHALDALRAAQERWQELARALPLERKAEQAMWHRFRAACDAVFAKRKESAHAADAERRTHQAAKDAVSARLEASNRAGVDATALSCLLREAAAEWQAIGPVPRAAEAKVDKRYQAAIAAVQQQAQNARRAAGAAQAGALRDKLRLCQRLEAELARPLVPPSDDSGDWDARWAALPALQPDYEAVLAARFKAAQAVLAAADDARAVYVRLLEQNRPTLLQEILRLEIAAGIDSGSEFARERLKLQVEVLQSSLKSGQKPLSQAAQLRQLCAMPALADDRTASRIDQLFASIGRDIGKDIGKDTGKDPG